MWIHYDVLRDGFQCQSKTTKISIGKLYSSSSSSFLSLLFEESKHHTLDTGTVSLNCFTRLMYQIYTATITCPCQRKLILLTSIGSIDSYISLLFTFPLQFYTSFINGLLTFFSS